MTAGQLYSIWGEETVPWTRQGQCGQGTEVGRDSKEVREPLGGPAGSQQPRMPSFLALATGNGWGRGR